MCASAYFKNLRGLARIVTSVACKEGLFRGLELSNSLDFLTSRKACKPFVFRIQSFVEAADRTVHLYRIVFQLVGSIAHTQNVMR